MLKAAVQASKKEKRPLMTGNSGKAGKQWCEKVGAELALLYKGFKATTEDIDFAALESKVKEIKATTARGIDVKFYIDGFPDELLQEVCDLYNVVFPLLPKGQMKTENWLWTVDRLKERIEFTKIINRTRRVLLARDSKTGTLCGISEAGWGKSSPGEFLIYYGAILPAYQKKGLGTLLMNELILRSKERGGIDRIETDYSDDNTAAEKIIKRAGFKQHEERYNWQIDVSKAEEFVNNE